MEQLSEILMENSLQAMLASIEIYNKPDFKYREQTFTILHVNAWELLFKAKILCDSSEDVTSIYAKTNDGRIKHNRSNNPMTIEVIKCMNIIGIDPIISENIKYLLEIRDAAVHFPNDDSISYIVYTLGVASLKNYQKLIKDWFGKSLLNYNFYIMPLAFAYNFKTITMLEFEKKPEIISNLINSISITKSSLKESDEYNFECEIFAKVQSAKKLVDEADIIAGIVGEEIPNIPIIYKTQMILDKYPLTYMELIKKVQETKYDRKSNEINDFIKDHQMKKNKKYCDHIFTSKKQYDNYINTGILEKNIKTLYSQDALIFILENIDGYCFKQYSTKLQDSFKDPKQIAGE